MALVNMAAFARQNMWAKVKQNYFRFDASKNNFEKRLWLPVVAQR